MVSLGWLFDPANRTDALAFVAIVGLVALSGAFLGFNIGQGGVSIPTPLAILPAVGATIVAALVAARDERTSDTERNGGY